LPNDLEYGAGADIGWLNALRSGHAIPLEFEQTPRRSVATKHRSEVIKPRFAVETYGSLGVHDVAALEFGV